jgi:nucleotide-binding universal stress UspA family protein
MYRSIVVGTDGSDTAAIAVDHAANLARALGATLHVVSAYREPSIAAAATSTGALTVNTGELAQWSDDAMQELRTRLGATCDRLEREGVKVVACVERGEPSSVLISVAAEVDADLIVVGDRGLTGIRRLFGSVPGSLTRKSPVAVLVVHTSGR